MKHGYQPAGGGERPAAPVTGSGVKAPGLLNDANQPPSLGRIVLVQTAGSINGQAEHAAIITQVHPTGLINVMLMPGAGDPYPVQRIGHRDSVESGGISWRWPPRV